jgi:hypothetical protein
MPADNIDDGAAAPADEGTGSPEGTPAVPTPNQPTEVELARRRQAGAEKARQETERQLAEANARIEALSAGKPADQLPVDMKALLKQAKDELKAEFDAEYAKKTEKLTADTLNERFPAARAKFPSVTDTAQLAELEAVFGEASVPETPKPVGNNPQKGATGAKPIEEMTSAELQAEIKKLPREAFGLPPL